VSLTIRNLPPKIGPVSSLTGFEGQSVTLSAMFSDAGALDSHSASISWGDGSTSVGAISEIAGSGNISATHVYADNGSYTISVQVQDKEADSDSQITTATIANVAPTVTPASPVTVLNNTPIILQVASFSDPGFTDPAAGTQESFTATIDWGDNTGAMA